MAGINDDNDDLVMESTTDTPEQIAAGLRDEAAAASEGADDAGAEGEADPSLVPDASGVVTDDGQVEEEVVEQPATAAPVKAGRPQRKTVDGAAAAARRRAGARVTVLETENEALRARLKELAANPGAAAETRERVAERREPVAVQPIAPEQIPDTHPDVARALAAVTALGPKPKQGDYPDFDEFEEKRDEWLLKRGRLDARVDSVREDVARRETSALDAANRAAQETIAAFTASVDASRARHADYDDVLADAVAQGHAVNRSLGEALMQRELGAEVLYHLASNPAELARIQKLPVAQQIIEAGILEGRLKATLPARTGQVRRDAQGRPIRHTQAPNPQEAVLGDHATGGQAKDLNDPNLSQAEYNRLRDQMDEQSGRRRLALVR